MDNRELIRLRRELARGRINVGFLKQKVVTECRFLPKPNINKTLGAELSMIKDRQLRDYMYELLDRVPAYFWHIPASVVGFHDLDSDNQIGGLIRHSRKVARVAHRICEPYGLPQCADDFVVAGIMHDAFKYGIDGRIPEGEDHATFAANWLAKNQVFNDRLIIRDMVRTHLGRWGIVRPSTQAEWAFHIADYVVSRGASPSLYGKGRVRRAARN